MLLNVFTPIFAFEKILTVQNTHNTIDFACLSVLCIYSSFDCIRLVSLVGCLRAACFCFQSTQEVIYGANVSVHHYGC